MPLYYWFLIATITTEVAGTIALQASAQFTRPLPSLLVVVGYGLSFYFMALTLRFMPVGIVYAIWSGVGIVAITLVAWLAWGQRLDTPALLGMALIVAGVLVIHLFSGTQTHG